MSTFPSNSYFMHTIKKCVHKVALNSLKKLSSIGLVHNKLLLINTLSFYISSRVDLLEFANIYSFSTFNRESSPNS